MNFPFQRGAEIKNQSIVCTSKRDDSNKNKKFFLKKHIIVK